MNKKSLINTKVKTLTLLVMILMMSAYINFRTNTSNINSTSEESSNKNYTYTEQDLVENPKVSDIGLDEWWDEDFRYRMLINVTNPYSQGFTDYGASIEFDYSGNMQADLDDLRVVENGLLRNFFYMKDYPSSGKVTLWFETNITAGPDHLEQDTYLYYGNTTVGKAIDYIMDERFGKHWWDFEEGSGSTIDDIAPNNNVGELIGDTGFNSDDALMGDYALEFDGSDDYVQLATPYTYLNNITVSAWVKTTDSSGIVLSYDRSEIFRFGIGSSGDSRKVTWNTDGNPTGYDDMSGITDVNDGNWHLIAASYNTFDLTKTIYVDGKIDGGPQNYIPLVNPPELGTGNTRYGFMGTGSESRTYGDGLNTPTTWYNGLLDDVRMYDVALTEQELSWLYNLSKPLETQVNEEHAFTATVRVTAIDLYDNYIPNVNISIYNKTADPINPLESKIANSEGQVEFTDLSIGRYNFTVTMTSNVNLDYTILVNETSEAFLFEGIFSTVTLICDVSNHNFTITDVDNKPVESGWVLVGNETKSTYVIQKCPIDENGIARFWWLNDTADGYYYNYTVHYQNDDFLENIITLGDGSTTTPNEPIQVDTLLTTITFQLNQSDSPFAAIPGARLNLTNYYTKKHIGNITTDQNGNAILRWLNSTGIADSGDDNYELRIFFWAPDQQFNISADEDPPNHIVWNFTVSSETSYILRLNVNPDNYKTRIDSLNPSDSIAVTWGTQLKLRYLFNITQFTGKEEEEGPAYADIMEFNIPGVLSGSFEKEEEYEGRHIAIIDTGLLESSDVGYTVIITAEKSGFTIPEPKTFTVNVEENDVEVIQTSGDSEVNVYWLEIANVTINPYGKNHETFEIEDNIFKDVNPDFEILIPDLLTEWNISQLIININDATFNQPSDSVNINITDDYGTKHTFDNTHPGHDVSEGTWENILIPLNIRSTTNDNTFAFKIEGTFDGSFDILADISFLREKINVQYVKFNVTDDINIYYDGNGWAIKNITFEISNCYNLSNWAPYDLSDLEALNITTNEGFKYSLKSGTTSGTGILTIDDRIIYPQPSNDYYTFTIDNRTDIIFDVIIKVEYIQYFYWSRFMDINNCTIIEQNFNNGGSLQVSYEDDDWTDSGFTLLINDINNVSDSFNPTDIGMTITIGTQTFEVENVDDGYGQFILSNYGTINKNTFYDAYITTNMPVNFTLSYTMSYSRTHTYLITTNLEYTVKGESIEGTFSFNEDLDYYEESIPTTSLKSQEYTVRFNVLNPNYDPLDQDQIELNLDVNERLTLINGRLVSRIGVDIYIKDGYNFTFTYTDAVFGTHISNLDVLSYEWEYFGNIPSQTSSGVGNLISNGNLYILDFDTETKAIGTYSLIVTLEKENYKIKTGIITLNIEEREIEYDLGDMFDDKQVSVVKGKTIKLEIELTDPTKGDIPLTGAKVVLEIGDDEFEFDEKDDGVYELEFDTEDYEAFFMSNTITGTIKISKADYISEEVDITIVVEMEEIVEGVPIFYFIMIAGAIAAVVGSLATYRFIQIARIPKFVKKARAMKKAIKGKKDIPESALTNSKEELIFNEFGDDWEEIGLSLKYVLGINGKKGKSIDGSDKLSKNKGGAE